MPNTNGQPMSLIPQIPDDILGARIGSCYDDLTRKIIDGAWEILPSKVTEDAVVFIPGRSELLVTSNSSSKAAANSSLFKLDTKIGGGFDAGGVSVDASVDYNMENAQATSSQEENLNVYCSFFYTGVRQELRKMDEHELLKLMTPIFQRKYKAVINATTLEEYIKAYMDFRNNFGYGCVTTLFLTAGSAFRLTLQHQDDATANRQKYGGSVSVSGSYAGFKANASVAMDWANEQQVAEANTHLEIVFDNLPQDTPTQKWAHDMLNTFTGLTVNDLVSKANLIAAPDIEEAPEAAQGAAADSTRQKESSANIEANGLADTSSLEARTNPIDPTSFDIDGKLRGEIVKKFPGVGGSNEEMQQVYELVKQPDKLVSEVFDIVKSMGME